MCVGGDHVRGGYLQIHGETQYGVVEHVRWYVVKPACSTANQCQHVEVGRLFRGWPTRRNRLAANAPGLGVGCPSIFLQFSPTTDVAGFFHATQHWGKKW